MLMFSTRQALIVGLLLAYAWDSYGYVRVWSSELRLAAYVAAHAPEKPRARLNLGRALLLSGRLDEAAVELDLAEELSAGAAVPSWDREDVRVAARQNRLLTAALRALQ